MSLPSYDTTPRLESLTDVLPGGLQHVLGVPEGVDEHLAGDVPLGVKPHKRLVNKMPAGSQRWKYLSDSNSCFGRTR